MKKTILALAACALVVAPVSAQNRAVGRSANPYIGNPYVGSPYGGNPYVNQYNGYGNPYAGSPYGSNPIYNPAAGGYNPWVNSYGNPYMYNGAPINSFGMPTSIGNGFWGMNANGHNFSFWKAPSGYYYPWTQGYGTGYSAPIVVINNGSNSPQPAQPPLSTVFSDTLKYLDEQKAAGKLSAGEFTHLKQRALDLMSKERDLRTQGSGSMDSQQEASIRADVDSLGGEIARSVKP